MNTDAFGNSQLQGGGSPAGKATSASSSATSGQTFGSLVSDTGGLTPLAVVILGVVTLLAFIALIVVAKK